MNREQQQQQGKDILETIKILPEEIVNKIFFYVNVPHPTCKVFKDYCKSLNLDITVPAYDDWVAWKHNPLQQHFIRSFYRDQTYFRFYNVYRRMKIQKQGFIHRVPQRHRKTNLMVNSTSFA